MSSMVGTLRLTGKLYVPMFEAGKFDACLNDLFERVSSLLAELDSGAEASGH